MNFVVLEHCGVDVGLFIRKYLVIGLIVAFLFGDLREMELLTGGFMVISKNILLR